MINTYPIIDCPDGQYPVKVVNYDVGFTKNMNRPRLWMLLELLGGPCAGEKHAKVFMLDRENSRKHLTKEFKTLGIETHSAAELAAQKDKVMNMTILANFQNKDERLNAYFMGTVGDSPAPTNGPVTSTKLDEMTW